MPAHHAQVDRPERACWPRRLRARSGLGAGPPVEMGAPRTLRQLRRRGEDLLRGVRVPDPFDLDAFCQSLAAVRQRPVHVVPLPHAAGIAGPCGAWAATSTADYLFYDPATAPLHREHILLHEVGHLLAEHQPDQAGERRSTGRPGRPTDGHAASSDDVGGVEVDLASVVPAGLAAGWESWLPDLSGETVRHVLGRTSYTTPQEQEAEMIATLILERGSRSPTSPVSAPGSPQDAAAVLGRLSDALGARARQR